MSYFVDAIASADNIRITPSLRSKKGKLLKMSAEYQIQIKWTTKYTT